jgi:uncharacterized protein YdhG (YjbR/CyaY superfamily)
MGAAIDEAVMEYFNAVPAGHRALLERVHRLVLDACPDATVVLSYKMPTYKVGKRRLHLAAWQHGVSIYGWKQQGDGGFTERHPELQTSTGTIQLRPQDAAIISDEIRDLARSALMGGGTQSERSLDFGRPSTAEAMGGGLGRADH